MPAESASRQREPVLETYGALMWTARLLACAIAGTTLLVSGGDGRAAPANACAATSPGTASCTVVMEGDGTYAASGTWRITVHRHGTSFVLDSAKDPATGSPGVVVAGDEVTAEALAPGSSVAVSRVVTTSDSARVSCDAGSAAYGTGGRAVDRRRLPDDPLLDAQWGLVQARVPEAWAMKARGARAVVAVVDTGVDLQHPDLAGALLPGIDLWESRPGGRPDCPGPDDEQFHGTAVAGVIAARADDGTGIAGVAHQARLLPVRVRDDVSSLDFSRVGAGIRWATDHGADVISLTGGVAAPVRSDPLLEEDIAEALAYAWSKGVVTVATAGNNSLPWCQYPSSAPQVVCASATTRDGAVASYSQLPIRADGGVAVLAPGGARDGSCGADVVTSVPPGSRLTPCGTGGGWASDSGTTYATAHTAGIAALLVGRGLSNTEVVECLRRTSSGGGTWDPVRGYGLVNAAAAVAGCPPGRKGR